MMGKVLVLDANQRSSLAIIRSLGRRGIEVVSGDHVANSIGGASRFTTQSVRHSDPAAFPSLFLSEIRQLVDHLAIETVIPATDLTTMLLLSQSSIPESVRLATPSSRSYETLTDKAHLIELAGRLGISTPDTLTVRTPSGVWDAAREFGFPLVLKPSRSRYIKGNRVVSTRVEIVQSPSSLSAILSSLTWLSDLPCLVQRFVPGHGAGVFALYGPYGPIAWFAHRRLREKPPSGGVSVLSESAPIDPTMRSAAETLLSAANWTGVAMVEFRVRADGTPVLMEVNGRFWGSLQLAIDCGIDFPWLLYQMLHDIHFEAPTSYPVGKRLRWLLGDFDSLLAEMRRPSPGNRHRAKVAATFLHSFADADCRQEILRLRDLGPGFLELWQWLRGLIG